MNRKYFPSHSYTRDHREKTMDHKKNLPEIRGTVTTKRQVGNQVTNNVEQRGHKQKPTIPQNSPGKGT